MKNGNSISISVIALCAGIVLGDRRAQAVPETEPVPASAPASSDVVPMVPPAKPGVYSETKQNATRYRLTIKGHAFTTRDAVEKYLLYRAANLSLQQHFTWFTLVERRGKSDTAPLPGPDPTGLHYSFRLKYWRPVWRYKLANSLAWSTWSPFSDAAFFADGKDAKTIASFEVSADIAMHKGLMDSNNPLAFEPRAVSDFLVNQVSPPL